MTDLDELAFREKLRGLRNWGRWGPDDQQGALNLVTAEKVLEAAALIVEGEIISLSRDLPLTAASNGLKPALHYLHKKSVGIHGEGVVVDFFGLDYHGSSTTHIDALCHVWNEDGMWNGRDPDAEVGFEGVTWCGAEQLSKGIVTRGVLLDIPRWRNRAYVTEDEPVTGNELEQLIETWKLDVRPGDALVMHAGREAWERANNRSLGSPSEKRPGFHESCLDFFHSRDCSLVVWDMLDCVPNDHGVSIATHAAIFGLGIPLVDNAVLDVLAERCAALSRHAFLLCVAPLKIVGGTGSPVNPLALL